MTTVGFVGPGNMGAPMVGRLLDAGHPVTIWARDPARCAPLLERGAQLATKLRDLASRSEVVVSCVANPGVLETLYLGEGGLLDGARADQVFVDHTTTPPRIAETIAAASAARGASFLDAPVSGGPQGAAAGALVAMVGGSASALEAARPVLAVYASAIHHCGATGSGQALKLINQFLVIVQAVAAGEAAGLVDAHGIDADTARRALGGGWAASTMLDLVLPRALARDTTSDGATLGALADVGELVMTFLAETSAPSILLGSATAALAQSVSRGGRDQGLGALLPPE